MSRLSLFWWRAIGQLASVDASLIFRNPFMGFDFDKSRLPRSVAAMSRPLWNGADGDTFVACTFICQKIIRTLFCEWKREEGRTCGVESDAAIPPFDLRTVELKYFGADGPNGFEGKSKKSVRTNGFISPTFLAV
jgi:hypothetical protein